jgi:DeoR/GlpR family transcriptional regulator of sugar metabolism
VADGAAFNANQMMVDVERRMMDVAATVVLAVDHHKLGKRALAKLCPLEEVDVLVTDAGASPQQLDMLRHSGAGRVIVAGADGKS